MKFIYCSFCKKIYACFSNFDFNLCENCGWQSACDKDSHPKEYLREGSFCNNCMDKSMATLQEEHNAR